MPLMAFVPRCISSSGNLFTHQHPPKCWFRGCSINPLHQLPRNGTIIFSKPFLTTSQRTSEVVAAANTSLYSFSNSSTQDLCPEKSTLRLFNHLLVNALRWVIHHHRAGLVINLCIHSSISDEIDNPLFAIIFR